MTDIAKLPIQEAKEKSNFEKRCVSMFLRLYSLTGLSFSEHKDALIEHLKEFRKDWTLLKVYKAFEYNQSIYTDTNTRIQCYGSSCTVSHLSDILKAYQLSINKKQVSTQAVYVEPTQEQKDKIAHEAVLVAFKRHKAGRHILLYKQYETLLKRFKMPDTYLDYMDKADIELKKRVIADKANAQLDNDRHKIKSLQQQLDNWQPVKANLIDVAKELAIKDYFDSLSKQHLEL